MWASWPWLLYNRSQVQHTSHSVWKLLPQQHHYQQLWEQYLPLALKPSSLPPFLHHASWSNEMLFVPKIFCAKATSWRLEKASSVEGACTPCEACKVEWEGKLSIMKARANIAVLITKYVLPLSCCDCWKICVTKGDLMPDWVTFAWMSKACLELWPWALNPFGAQTQPSTSCHGPSGIRIGAAGMLNSPAAGATAPAGWANACIPSKG